jgi:hypothetical protein
VSWPHCLKPSRIKWVQSKNLVISTRESPYWHIHHYFAIVGSMKWWCSHVACNLRSDQHDTQELSACFYALAVLVREIRLCWSIGWDLLTFSCLSISMWSSRGANLWWETRFALLPNMHWMWLLMSSLLVLDYWIRWFLELYISRF